ncbi:hypothetical protein B0O99DRAFT_688413 [Bisporella sp. PMI_857]|nr:hypothetical protein B0O99DRAFT_688413 [Bisporella sp. PMI_857]
MNNAGSSPIVVPGFGGLPINHEIDANKCFNDGATKWTQCPRLSARELAMMALMEFLTNKEGWETEVFDDTKVAGWRTEVATTSLTITLELEEELVNKWGEIEVTAVPLISDKAWNWCILELKDKAVDLNSKGFVRVMDAGSCVCKSDILVSTTLTEELKNAIEPLREEFWSYNIGNGSHKQISDIVDPSIFPLVYGKTRVYQDGTQIGRDDCVEICSNILGKVAPSLEDRLDHETQLRLWSLRFQWLPCEVKFAPDRDSGLSITSYINNLHPTYYKRLYSILEHVMKPAIHMWNDCLFKGVTAPAPIRIRTYGYEKGDPSECTANLWERMRSFWENGGPFSDQEAKEYTNFLLQIENFLDNLDCSYGYNIHFLTERLKQMISTRDRNMGRDEDTALELGLLVDEVIQSLHMVAHPEPGSAFSYKDWKLGKNGKAIVASTDPVIRNSKRVRMSQPVPDPDNGIYRVSLHDEFVHQGLQIIVRFRDIELTPAQPVFTSKLSLEAQRNEHIVATAAYVYSTSNIHTPKVSFHQFISMDEEEYDFKEDSHYLDDNYMAMRTIFGFMQSAAAYQMEIDTAELRFFMPGKQTQGTVLLPSKRLLTWPNTLEHRLEPVSLLDSTRNGHLRILFLYLVDPNYRIVSTSNVPPQQHNWWVDAALDRGVFASEAARDIPVEVRQLIDEATEEWPMGWAEARRLKVEVDRERLRAQNEVESWNTGFSHDRTIGTIRIYERN